MEVMFQDCSCHGNGPAVGAMGATQTLNSDSGLVQSTLSPPPTSNPCPSVQASQRLHTAAKARPVLAVGALVACSDVLSCWSYKTSHRGVNSWFAQLWGVISSFLSFVSRPSGLIFRPPTESCSWAYPWAHESAQARRRHGGGSGQGRDSTYHEEDEVQKSGCRSWGCRNTHPTGSSS